MSDWWSADPVASSAPATAAPSSDNWWHADPVEQAAPKETPARSVGGQLLTGQENILSAAEQRTTPQVGAHAPNYLGPATITEEGDVGYKDPAGKFVATDRSQHVVLTDPADGVPKIYSRTPTTNEGPVSSLGRVAMQGMGAGAVGKATSGVAKALPEVTQAGERIGVNVPRAISSEVPGMNLLGQASSKVPGGGPLYKGIQESIEDTGKAVGAAAEKAGGAANAKEAGEAFRQGYAENFGKGGAVPTEISRLYDEVDKFVDPNIRVGLDNTRATVTDIMARRANYGKEGVPKAVSEVINSIRKPGGFGDTKWWEIPTIDYKGIKDLRTDLGELLKKTPEGVSYNQLNKIYGALSDDLKASIQAGGGAKGMAAWERANTAARTSKEWQASVAKVLGTETRSDEDVTRAIQRMAGTGAGADIETLARARLAVPPQAWQKVASNAVGKLGFNDKGEFSPSIFLNDYGNLSKEGKRLLFHSVGSGDLIPHLDDVNKVSQSFNRAGKLGNPSGTAGHAATFGAGAAALTGIMHGSMVEPLSALGTVVGNNILARWLRNPATAASTSKWMRTYDAVVKTPSPRSVAMYNMASRNLASTAGGDVGRLTTQLQGAIKPRTQEEQAEPEGVVQ